MPFATRHRDDPLRPLPALPGLSVRREKRASIMAAFQDRPLDDIQRRFDSGHRAYIALVGGLPAAWGWVATRTASIGEVNTTFTLPAGERYLWNFVTLRSFRGLGIYPRLLRAIVRAESRAAERFWIAYAPENHASGSGIEKAGFTTLAEMSFDASGSPALHATTSGGAAVLSQLLGLRESIEPLTPCWRCVKAGRAGMSCTEGSCRCDYQRPQNSCAA